MIVLSILFKSGNWVVLRFDDGVFEAIEFLKYFKDEIHFIFYGWYVF